MASHTWTHTISSISIDIAYIFFARRRGILCASVIVIYVHMHMHLP